MRIKKNINEGITGWSNTKSSSVTSCKLYGSQQVLLLMKSNSQRVRGKIDKWTVYLPAVIITLAFVQ